MDLELGPGSQDPSTSERIALRRAASKGPVHKFVMAYAEPLVDIASVVCVLIIFLVTETAEPRVNFIPLDMLFQYSYPLKAQTVPAWACFMLAFLAPATCFIAHWLLQHRPIKELYRLILVLTMSILLTVTITNCIKITVARPRPNFVVKCWPDSHPVWDDENQFGGYAGCTTPISDYGQHLKSFPSGHSSSSAAGLGFLTFFLLGQTRALASGKHVWRLTLSLLPALGALAIGVSRVVDFWHHPTDVIAGLLLGFGISLAMYRHLYPSWTNAECSVPLYELLQRQKLRQSAALTMPLLQNGSVPEFGEFDPPATNASPPSEATRNHPENIK